MDWRDRILVGAALASVASVASVSAFAQSDIPAAATQSSASVLIAHHAPAPVLQLYVRDADAAIPVNALPANLTFHRFFRPALESMIRRSPTFRRQCRRLASAANLRVHVGNQVEPLVNGPRARTSIGRTADGMIFATAFIRSLENPVELIAHEVEHVIEHLDGIDLRSRSAISGSGVRRQADGSFETLRAVHVGRAVARESSVAR